MLEPTTVAEAYEIAEGVRRTICAETEVFDVQVHLFVPHGEDGKATLTGA